MKLVIAVIGLVIFIIILRSARRKTTVAAPMPVNKEHELLSAHVAFYRRLVKEDQRLFRERVQHFLNTVAITPVGGVAITDLDRLYVAASAIIPIFSFTDWAYNNLNEVLIYPGTFTKDFKGAEAERNVLGMVGDGAMHRMMVLSIQSLRAGFEYNSSGNTGIHEFVHLLDKADGSVDGVPEAMLPKELVAPWVQYMHEAIREIRNNDSDINPYAGTNEAEFFAVISEYFFQKPEALKDNHPELVVVLEKIFKQKVA